MACRDNSLRSETASLAEQESTPSTTASLNNTTDATLPAAPSTTVSGNSAKEERRAAAALHNAQQGHKDSSNTRFTASHFPFLRLPAELRNSIYAYALLTSRRLSRCWMESFTIPPLLHVSKQVRSETVGVPMAVNAMELIARSNLVVHNRPKNQDSQTHRHFGTGLLQLDSDRNDWLDNDEIVFRDARIVATCACCNRAPIGAFHVTIVDGHYVLKWLVWYRFDLENIDKFFKRIEPGIKKVLEEAEARSGAVGLKHADLQKIAKCFHWIETVVLDDDDDE